MNELSLFLKPLSEGCHQEFDAALVKEMREVRDVWDLILTGIMGTAHLPIVK